MTSAPPKSYHCKRRLPGAPGIRSSAWLGRVEQLKADMVKLQAFIETLTQEERTGPLKTVNQVRALGWGMAIQMEAVVLQAERPNEKGQR